MTQTSFTKISDILTEVGKRVSDAFELPIEHVLHDPRSSELPDVGVSYASIRCEILGGSRETGGYDSVVLRIDIAAELDDPGVETVEPLEPNRREDRMLLLGLLLAHLTPYKKGQITAKIPGWEEQYLVEALTSAIDDAPGRLLVAATFEGTVTIGRGGLM